ncbi:hypothetical protein WJX73_000823 [Symbiochloris irregularis]|uniref:Uncharacterized protein n=1 Tax=Symbiochloris irregularis TaxID=706552 RepID=A0AAW1NW38_9CHLO
MPSRLVVLSVLILLIRPSFSPFGAPAQPGYRPVTSARGTMAPLEEAQFTFGEPSSAGWTKERFLPQVDSLFGHVTKSFGYGTRMSWKQLTQIRTTWACLGILALAEDQMDGFGSHVDTVPGRASDGRRPTVNHFGSCSHGYETQRNDTCPAGKLCAAATRAAEEASGCTFVHFWMNVNASCIRAAKHCISGTLGRLLDEARVKIIIATKLIYEAYFGLYEVASVVSSTASAALLLTTMHFSAVYGTAAEWLPFLRPYFHALVWLVPYYNACIGCTASPVTWGALYKLQHSGLFMAGLLSAMLQRAANAGLRLSDAMVDKAVELLRLDPLVAGRLICGHLSFRVWAAAHLNGTASSLYQSHTRPARDCQWCERVKDRIKNACVLGTDIICETCAAYWRQCQRQRTPAMERRLEERKRELQAGKLWSCPDCPYLISGVLERGERGSSRQKSGKETIWTVNTAAGPMRLAPSSVEPGLPAVTICLLCSQRGLKGLHTAAALMDSLGREGGQLTQSQVSKRDKVIREAQEAADKYTLRDLSAQWLLYLLIKEQMVVLEDGQILMVYAEGQGRQRTGKVRTCKGSFTADCRIRLEFEDEESVPVTGPIGAEAQLAKWCNKGSVRRGIPAYDFVLYCGQSFSSWRNDVMSNVVERVEYLASYAVQPMALAEDVDDAVVDAVAEAQEVKEFLKEQADVPALLQKHQAASLATAPGQLPRSSSLRDLGGYPESDSDDFEFDEGRRLTQLGGFFPGTGTASPASPLKSDKELLAVADSPARPSPARAIDLTRTTSSPDLQIAYPPPPLGGVNREVLAAAAMKRMAARQASKRGERTPSNQPSTQPAKKLAVAKNLQKVYDVTSP